MSRPAATGAVREADAASVTDPANRRANAAPTTEQGDTMSTTRTTMRDDREQHGSIDRSAAAPQSAMAPQPATTPALPRARSRGALLAPRGEPALGRARAAHPRGPRVGITTTIAP